MSVFAPNLHAPDIEAAILPGLEAVEDLLQKSVTGSRDLIDELTQHLAAAGGKRIRPALALVCSHLGDPELAVNDKSIRAATTVELTHLASLYHDDVMDSAPTRRGVASAQHQWGNNRAILAGDVLFARASSIVAGLGPEAVRHHAVTFERLCLGQLNETFGPKAGEDPVDFYIQVLADKTGSLVAEAAHSGAYHANATPEVCAVLDKYGERSGVAFQIADDVIDLTSPGSKSGKTPGTDLREGVDTLPVLLLRRHAADGSIDDAGAEILDALAGDLSSDEALASVVGKLREHPVLGETQALARLWVRRAIAAIEPLPHSEAKDALVTFTNMMVDRSF